MANINDHECGVPDVCRLCGKEEAFLLPIFNKYGKDKHIANKIEICLPKLKISPTDELPTAICYKCMFILDQCSDFCTRANNANAVMQRQYSTTAQPCSSSDESQMPARKRIKPVNADKYGKFPHQWFSMADDITASGSSASSEDSLSRRTSKINIRTPTSKPSKKMQEKITLGEGTASASFQAGNSVKARARGPSNDREAASAETSKLHTKNHRERAHSTVVQSRHTDSATNYSFDITQTKTPKDKQIKALFESKWMDDPLYLPSPERETDCESDTNKSWSSARTTLSDIFGKVQRNKNSKRKDQQVPSLKCVNSMQDSAMKKVPMWEQRLCPGSSTDSDSCGGLTPTLGPEWCQKE